MLLKARFLTLSIDTEDGKPVAVQVASSFPGDDGVPWMAIATAVLESMQVMLREFSDPARPGATPATPPASSTRVELDETPATTGGEQKPDDAP